MQSSTEKISKAKGLIFAIYFGFLTLLAIFPPFYLSISQSEWVILGIPLPFFYWIMIAVLLMIGLTILYVIEEKLGEIPADGEA